TRELAQAVGVSEPVLYMHFPSKRDLYSALLEEMCKEPEVTEDQFRRLFAEEAVENDDKIFRVIADGVKWWDTARPSRLRHLLYSALEGHELSELFYHKHVFPFHNALRDYIARGIEQGRYRAIDPLNSARAFCGMIASYCQALAVLGLNDSEEQRTQAIENMV